MNKSNLQKGVDRGYARICRLRETAERSADRQHLKTAAIRARKPCNDSAVVAAPIIQERNACPYGYACPYPPAQPAQVPPAAAPSFKEPEYVSPYEIAAQYGININTVYKLINDGKVDAFRIGRCWRVVAKSVKRAFNIE